MPYRAQRQSLNEIGGPSDSGPAPDYGRIVDAFANGASTLIQQSYIRKLQQNQLAREDEQRKYERGRQASQDQFERDKFGEEQRKNRADEVFKGYDEAPHTETTTTRMPTGAMATPGAGAITRAMTSGRQELLGRAPMEDVATTRTTVPAGPHIDLEKNVPYRIATDRATITAEQATERARLQSEDRAKLQTQRLEAAQSGRMFMAERAEFLTRLRAKLAADAKSSAAKAMTGNALEKAKTEAAQGLLAIAGGSVDHALEMLNEDAPEAKSFRDVGVELRHLAFAKNKTDVQGTAQATREKAASGVSAPEAAASVDSTRRAVSGPPSRLRMPGAKADVGPTGAAGAKTAAAAKPTYTKAQIETAYQAALAAGADPAKAKARRDAAFKTAKP